MGTVKLDASMAPYSTEPRCKWFNDEAVRLAASGLGGGQAAAAATALRLKASDNYCLKGATGPVAYPSMQYVEGDLFRLKDGDECRWARTRFLQVASLQPTAGVIMDAEAQRQRTKQAGCYRY